jgi:hypothetical protein
MKIALALLGVLVVTSGCAPALVGAGALGAVAWEHEYRSCKLLSNGRSVSRHWANRHLYAVTCWR